MEPLGRHLLIEMWGCNGRIDDVAAVEVAIRDAVAAVGATLLNLHVHAFNPHGVTGVAALAESHIALHSWPERGYLAADVFTCGPATHLAAALDVFQTHFEPQSVDVLDVARGRPEAALECGGLSPLYFRPERLDCRERIGEPKRPP
jgi:S-adenosylmethionine decarboxylase